MKVGGRVYSLILLGGDIVFLILALWLSLGLRYWQWPTSQLFWSHLFAFSPIFVVWVLVYLIFDLYRRQTLLLDRQLVGRILEAQFFNLILAALVFYFLPSLSLIGTLTPKTNLLIYLLVSSVLMLWWRHYLAQFLYRSGKLAVFFDCRGPEVTDLEQAMQAYTNYQLVTKPASASVVVVNRYEPLSDAHLIELYRSLFSGVRFVGVQDLYEDLFGRIPLSLIDERWFLERVSARSPWFYDWCKRWLDVIVSFCLGVISLALYPFIALAIKLDDGGPLFYYDRRVGRYGREIKIAKFRTLSTESDLAARRVTRVGAWLRRTRLDELPQLWSVLAGDQSLIGPRPEKREYVDLYRERIPFYDVRHLIAPGLSGWAQIYHDNHPHFAVAEDATREKLSYDLYYVKNRSFWLDITIALKTIKTVLSRSGR